jgi:hypothetical protein
MSTNFLTQQMRNGRNLLEFFVRACLVPIESTENEDCPDFEELNDKDSRNKKNDPNFNLQLGCLVDKNVRGQTA